MKKLIFILALLVNFQFSNAQLTTRSFNLKGKVKFIEEASYSFELKFGELEKNFDNVKNCMEFNEKGYLIKKYELLGEMGRSQKMNNIFSYVYINNERGRLKEINEYKQLWADYGKELQYRTKFKYDETGNLIQKIIYNADGRFNSGSNFIYEKDKIIEKVIFNEEEYEGEIEEGLYEANFLPSNENNIFEIYGEQGCTGELTNEDILDLQGNWIKRIEYRGKKKGNVKNMKEELFISSILNIDSINSIVMMLFPFRNYWIDK